MSADESVSAAGAGQAGTEAAEPAPPVLRLVSGNPTAEEIAALVAVLAAAGSGGADDAATTGPRRSLWTDSSRVPGARLRPGPGAWRASGRPG